MPDTALIPEPARRISTGIEGLDTLLYGGLLEGGMYIINGPPGAGKTILGNQMAFHHVARGGRALYVTLLAETHARMLSHIRPLAFFKPDSIGDSLYYISGYQMLEDEGLRGLLRLLRTTIRDQRATLLILDGLATAEVFAEDDLSFKRFLHELQAYTEARGCTTLLLTPQSDVDVPYPGHTMVDGLISLDDTRLGMRAVRELAVRKFRGSGHIRGRHLFEINDEGLVVHPRIEALFANPSVSDDEDRMHMEFGIPRLDEMIHGGIPSRSTTTLLGVPGSGKTMLGLHFLAAGAEKRQHGLYFGFYETPNRLIDKANQVGLDFHKHIEQGLIEIVWQPPVESLLDALAERLLASAAARPVRRLFIDGLDAFQEAAGTGDRIGRFFTALSNELRGRGVTTLFSVEMANLFSPDIAIPIRGISAITDNIILLRYVEIRSQLYRLISIMKMRESAYDPGIREFQITSHGIDVAPTFQSAESILTGIARHTTLGADPLAPGRTALYGQEPGE